MSRFKTGVTHGRAVSSRRLIILIKHPNLEINNGADDNNDDAIDADVADDAKGKLCVAPLMRIADSAQKCSAGE